MQHGYACSKDAELLTATNTQAHLKHHRLRLQSLNVLLSLLSLLPILQAVDPSARLQARQGCLQARQGCFAHPLHLLFVLVNVRVLVFQAACKVFLVEASARQISPQGERDGEATPAA